MVLGVLAGTFATAVMTATAPLAREVRHMAARRDAPGCLAIPASAVAYGVRAGIVTSDVF